MKFAKRKPPLILILTVILMALLPMLAVLQYRWVGQVSESERERLQTSLRAEVTKLTHDFDWRLTRVYTNFNISPPELRRDIGDAPDFRKKMWEIYAERLDRWKQDALDAELVTDAFVIEGVEARNLRLARLVPHTRVLEPVEWPAAFSDLRQRVERNYGPPRDEREAIIQTSIDTIAEEIPALLMPIPVHDFSDDAENFDLVRFHAYLVVTLNLEYIKERLIPALAEGYFSSNDKIHYDLAIVERKNPEHVIYQTNTDLSIFSSADATAHLFKVLYEEMDHMEVFEDTIHIEKPGKQVADKRSRPMRMAVKFFKSVPGKTFDMTVREPSDGRWQLMLKHRAGSLEAVVASTRRQNLIASFGILLVLGISVGVIIISTRRAERLAKQQMEFVAGVSHEFRTPLAVICSAGENLADGVIDDREQVRRYGSVIRSEGRRLTEMVEQVLEFAGIQSGRKIYEPRPVDVRDCIEGAVAACGAQIEEGGFRIEKDFATDLPPVAADSFALNRSIQNLLSNAMKYGGDSRWVRIKAHRVAGERGAEVQITVEDKGPGIAAPDMPHIFEPFYRGKEVTAAQIHGNGLGLSLVKHILDAHGGRVSVESATGRGSAFTLHLPVAAGPAA